MQIQCPECKAKLSLGQPKPGKFRPKCKHCGKPFVIKVSSDDPPNVAVGRYQPSVGANKTVKPTDAQQPSSKRPAVKSTAVDAVTDATVDNAAGPRPPDATGATRADLDATMDDTSGADAGDSRVSQRVSQGVSRGASQTRANVDATMDQSVAGERVASSSGGTPIVRSGHSQTKRTKQGSSKTDDPELAQIPERLGGYKILRILGRGAMGAVYEAKQISLDRSVALKTIRGRLSENAASLARFTREAYAAAQLTHHNVVQIYDFGEDDGKHFFSMEWVRGGPLSDTVRDKGAVEPKLAAGYALQAARGLQFAHQHGMVHRDVKPANLLLSDEGVVKVADLGLVKIPDQIDPESDVGVSSVSGLQSGTQVTMMGTAVGTPAYMAPEQGIDAASVDHRADIYSLGCSLFYMLSGQPPFDGSDVSSVLKQHAQQAAPDLVSLNSRIPSELSQIVQRSMAKRPDDRYSSLVDMISDLESYLGISKDGSFSPSSTQADQWEAIAKRYAKATPLRRLSSPIFWGFTLVCGLLTLVLPFVGLSWLLMAPATWVTAIITAVWLAGGQSAVGTSVRTWISSLSWFDYVVAVFGGIVVLLVSLATGSWLGLFIGLVLGAAAGASYHFGIVVPTRQAASDSVASAEKFVRDLRIDGADEDGVRSFAARYGGKSWQPLFESLFGYDSLCQVRSNLSSDPTFAQSTKSSLRDQVSARFLSKAEANQQARDHKRLANIEERGLASQGVNASDARDQAWQMAQAIIANAQVGSASNLDAAMAVQLKRERQKEMMAEARSGKYANERDKFAVLKFALGGQTRLLAGCGLLAFFALWGQTNGLFTSIQTEGVSFKTLEGLSAADLFGACVGSLGLAGALLCMSSFVSGWRISPFAIIATLVILFGGAICIPAVGPLAAWIVAGAVGVAIYVPGIIWGNDTEF